MEPEKGLDETLLFERKADIKEPGDRVLPLDVEVCSVGIGIAKSNVGCWLEFGKKVGTGGCCRGLDVKWDGVCRGPCVWRAFKRLLACRSLRSRFPTAGDVADGEVCDHTGGLEVPDLNPGVAVC